MKWLGYLGTAALTVSFALTPAPAESAIYLPQTLNAVHHPNQAASITVDAAVTDITGPTTEVEPGDAVFIDVTIANLGTETKTCQIGLFLTFPGPPVNGGGATLKPGAATTITLQWNTGTTLPGDHYLTAKVLLYGDQNPDNDSLTMTTPVTIAYPPQTVDAAVTDITGPTTEVEPEATVFINVTIANHGSKVATFEYRLGLESSGIYVIGDLLTLDPGATTTLSLQWDTGSTAPGDHYLTARVILADDQNPDNDSLTMTTPVTIAGPPQITIGGEDNQGVPDATYFGGLSANQITTQRSPVTALFISGHAVTAQSSLAQPNIESNGNALLKIFVANADATFGTSNALKDPFQNGEVRGTVLLDYQSSSSGAYLAAGDLRFFANPDGSFHGMIPAGTLDLEVRAPGFLPVVMPGVLINPGETLTIPQVTLPFGDGDSDGHINIVDFAVLARNYGFTVHWMDPPGP